MNIKEWLNRGFELRRDIMKKERRIVALEDGTLNISPHIDTVGGYNSSSKPVKVNLSDKKVDEEADLAVLYEEYNAVITEIQAAIDMVDDDIYKTLLELRHIKFEAWEVIAHKLSYSKTHIRGYLHKQALKKLIILC